MANNPNTPYGFQPVQNEFASYRANARVCYIPAATTNAMFLGDPVIITTTTTNLGQGYPSIVLATAGSSNKVSGHIVGFLGASPNGAFFANSGTPGPMYKATNQATAWWCLVDDSYLTEFQVQCTGTPTAAIVGHNVNAISGQGGKTTGWSGWQVSATATNLAGTQYRVVRFVQDVSNVIGNKFPKLVVRLNQPTESPATAGV